MKKAFVIFFVLLTYQSVQAQKENSSPVMAIEALLKEGTYSLKMVNMAIIENKVEDNNVLYVDPETGVIEMEDPQFQNPPEAASPVLELRTNTSIQYKISQKGELIHIEPVQNKNMPSVTIDLAKNVVKVEGQKLNFEEKLQVTSKENMFRSAWNGYRWKFESNSAGSTMYRFTIGKIERTGQLYLEVLGPDAKKENEKGFYHYRFLT